MRQTEACRRRERSSYSRILETVEISNWEQEKTLFSMDNIDYLMGKKGYLKNL